VNYECNFLNSQFTLSIIQHRYTCLLGFFPDLLKERRRCDRPQDFGFLSCLRYF